MFVRVLILTIGLGSMSCFAAVAADSEVRIWEEKISLPTYFTDPQEESPIFFQNDSYQGASRVAYPYPYQDDLSMVKGTKEYTGLFIENEYIKLCVLPQFGGRLFYATDKTNGYELFYRQNVIKPMLIGMLGAWISGGVEFCVFHHHRATTHMPVEYRLVENPDGSKTIWIGELELRQRMRWNIGISLFPGKSWVRVDGTLINATENVNSFLYWANVAVHVNEDYQVFFPRGTEYAVYHAKNSFAHWPITTETYNGKDYYQGNVDASWYRNHPMSGSFFAHDIKEGNLAGYDWGKQAGTMHVANHHIVKGAKLWQWGRNSTFDREALTDNDGPYAELMAGAYSDNQPDYSWIKPYEVKQFQQTWYPLRETEGMKFGNLDATVNLEVREEGEVFLAANTTSRFERAKVVLKHSEEAILEKTIDIDPATPFSHSFVPGGEVREEELELVLSRADGTQIISYEPETIPYNRELPPVVEPPGSPDTFATIEELYYAGERIRQFHNARVDPSDYFLAGLERDPSDVRCNTAMGIIRQEKGDFKSAKHYFEKAIARITANYTRPRDCEPLYHLGVILKREGDYEAAVENLYRAAWDYAFRSAAYFQLAQIHATEKDFAAALKAVDESLAVNGQNINAMSLRTSLLRLSGKKEEAIGLAWEILEIDRLNTYANNELVMLLGEPEASESRSQLRDILRDYPENYLELASYYVGSGLYPEGIAVLQSAVELEKPEVSGYPTVHYWLGYLYHLIGEREAAEEHFAAAREKSIKYCFPFRLESIPVFETALTYHEKDARACYYLGNLLYDKQPELAMDWWRKAVQFEPELAMAHRNLGWGYQQTDADTVKAIAAYQAAIRHDSSQPRYFSELDKLYELNGEPIKTRVALLTANHEHVNKLQGALMREILVLVLSGDYDRAVELMDGRTFYRQEDVSTLHDLHVDAHLLRGRNHLITGDAEAALNEFLVADTYPENQMIERAPGYERNPQVFYFTAQAYEAQGEQELAKKFYEKAVSEEDTNTGYQYYEAMAQAKLGRAEEAEKAFAALIESGQQQLEGAGEIDFFAKFGGEVTEGQRKAVSCHAIALGYLGQGDAGKANEFFRKALDYDVNHLWSKVYLANP